MAADTNINQLIINRLTEEQYNEAKEAGNIIETELYMTMDDDNDEKNSQIEQKIADINQILSEHSVMLSGKSYIHKWQKATAEYSVRDSLTALSVPGTITYSSAVGITDTGQFGLVNPTTQTLQSNKETIISLLTDKYFIASDGVSIFKFNTATKNTQMNAYAVDGTAIITQVSSLERNTYPDGRSDNLTYYTYLGEFKQPSIPRIETGVYVGTGTYGTTSPTRITLDIDAKVLFLVDTTAKTSAIFLKDRSLYAMAGNTAAYTHYSSYHINIMEDGVIEWYAGKAADQLNTSGNVVNYYAFG